MPFSNKVVLGWNGNYRLTAKNAKGLTASFDAPISFGGEESALSPMENVIASLAACSSIHVLSELKEKNQQVTGYQVEIEGQRKEEPPRTFTKIHIKYVVKGTGLNELSVKNAITEAEDKYWSVGTMLRKAVPITSSLEIIEG
jgi:putative redox protein